MQGAQVADQVASYVGEFILGGIAMLGLGVALWAIRQYRQSDKDHVTTLKAATNQHVEMHKGYQSSNAEVVRAIGRLTDTENMQTGAIQTNTNSIMEARAELRAIKGEISSLRRSVDDIIREAVRKRRSSDRHPVVKGEQ